MQQLWFDKPGPPDSIILREADEPTPGPGQVRIAVHAAGINFADLMARMGLYQDAPPYPFVVGYEVAGVIDALGEGVAPERLGQPVLAMTRFGGYSSSVVVDDLQAVQRPGHMPAHLAAALPVTGLTNWMMLEVMGRVREGDRVLVHSAGGGIGLMALDLLKFRGAHAIGTASAGKHAFLKDWGYDELIDYRSQDYAEVLAGREGLDLILDPLGGDSWSKGLDLLRPGGRLIAFGNSTATGGANKRSWISFLKSAAGIPWLKANPVALINGNKGLMGVNMGRMWDEGERVTGWLAELLKRHDEGHLRIRVHRVFPFSRAAEAHQFLHDRKNLGKVVLVPDAHYREADFAHPAD